MVHNNHPLFGDPAIGPYESCLQPGVQLFYAKMRLVLVFDSIMDLWTRGQGHEFQRQADLQRETRQHAVGVSST